jgi:hypothetical protein
MTLHALLPCRYAAYVSPAATMLITCLHVYLFSCPLHHFLYTFECIHLLMVAVHLVHLFVCVFLYMWLVPLCPELMVTAEAACLLYLCTVQPSVGTML